MYCVFVCIYVYFTCNYIENQLEVNLYNKPGYGEGSEWKVRKDYHVLPE